MLEETLSRMRHKSGECERLHSELASNNDALEVVKCMSCCYMYSAGQWLNMQPMSLKLMNVSRLTGK